MPKTVLYLLYVRIRKYASFSNIQIVLSKRAMESRQEREVTSVNIRYEVLTRYDSVIGIRSTGCVGCERYGTWYHM